MALQSHIRLCKAYEPEPRGEILDVSSTGWRVLVGGGYRCASSGSSGIDVTIMHVINEERVPIRVECRVIRKQQAVTQTSNFC